MSLVVHLQNIAMLFVLPSRKRTPLKPSIVTPVTPVGHSNYPSENVMLCNVLYKISSY